MKTKKEVPKELSAVRKAPPLLLNINGKLTYFMSLKDNAGLIKMYML
ncbi:hypothetical protein [Desulfosporosinus shakirovi]|nr:hypothetical protein [Desulfosporosinus sp. SRJS8]MCB8814683.1 hypothetical protein [Desulfosporosinus sp. SRJS8]